MFQTWKRIVTAAGLLLAVAVIAGSILFPRQSHWMPFRFYHVLSESMEPVIPADSLVCVKTYRDHMKIRKGDIITFQADRFGMPVIITHRFSHLEIRGEDEPLYRTHPQATDTPDPYETEQDDILGLYVFHIPFAGRWVQFLRSSFGIVWICELTVILIMRNRVIHFWNRQEEKDLVR